MKKIISIFSLSLILTACGGEQHNHNSVQEAVVANESSALPTPDTFKSTFLSSLDAYFNLKDALVQTDAVSAAALADALVSSIENVDTNGLSEEAAMLWDVAGADALAAAKALKDEQDVEVQREHFEPLSNAFIDMVKAYGPFDHVVYVQRCPMVRGGSADWLSKDEQVMNPYHGSRMMNCGSVIERI